MATLRDWRTDFIERHRDLFQPFGTRPTGQGDPDCGEGWRELLDRLCVRISAVVQADGGTFTFTQIEQKYGTLRVYWDSTLSPDADARAEEAIALAEARSAVTCEVCGEEGHLRGGARLTTRCETHSEGRPTVEYRSGLENIHLVRHFVAGRRFVTCRRYDRQNDVFIDVDPTSLGFEET